MKASILALTLSAFAMTNATAALVAHWPLNTNATDATGHGHNGTVVSTVNFGQPGANANTGTSAVFTGTGHIDVPWAAALNPGTQAPNGSGSFTVTLWAFPTTVGGAHRSPFTNREDNGASVNGPIIYVEPGGLWTYWAGNNGPSGTWNPINATAATANTWTHVGITYDSATTTRKMFLNGTEAASQVIGVSANLLRNLHIGGGADDGNSFTWAGRIDDVGYWNNALTQADIQRVMAGGVPEPTLTALLGLSAGILMRRRRR
jgi:hypothetical protein